MNSLIGTDEGIFTVGSINLEKRTTQTDVALLRQISLRSGGQLFTEASLEEFPDRLASDSLYTSSIQVQTTEFPLRTLPWVLAIVIFLLGMEWVIRKRCGLA